MSSGIWYPLISFRVFAYTRDIPGIYQCFEIYQGYLWLSQAIPWINQTMAALHRYIFSVFGIYHICSAQIRDIHDLIFEVWDIPMLVRTCWRYPWFNFWKLGYPQPGLHWLEISMVYLCSKQINMGYIWDIFEHAAFFNAMSLCSLTRGNTPCVACASQQQACGRPPESQFDCPLCLPLKAPQVKACPSHTGRGKAIWGWSR